MQKQKKKEEEKKKNKKKQDEKQKKQDEKIFDPDEVTEWVINKEKVPINNELFKKHFKVQVLQETKKINNLVDLFNSGLKDLEEEIKNMSEKEIEIEKPYNIVKVVKKILEINENNQEGKGLKILTPNQMLSRLPITLGQLKAGNNSEKL